MWRVPNLGPIVPRACSLYPIGIGLFLVRYVCEDFPVNRIIISPIKRYDQGVTDHSHLSGSFEAGGSSFSKKNHHLRNHDAAPFQYPFYPNQFRIHSSLSIRGNLIFKGLNHRET